MSALPGSSIIPIYASVPSGPIGPAGPVGPAGITGITGGSTIGSTGPTGSGIVGISYQSSGISFQISDGRKLYLQFAGITGVSFINGIPQSVVIGRGLTRGNPALHGHSILYSYVDSFDSNNQVVVQPYFANFNKTNDEVFLKLRTLEANGRALVGISADSSYIYLVGKTYDNRSIGNTGEILYKSDGLMVAIDGSFYNDQFNLLDVPMAADRYAVAVNNANNLFVNIQNENLIPRDIIATQLISGISGPSGFGFFNFSKLNFTIDNNNHILSTEALGYATRLFLGKAASFFSDANSSTYEFNSSLFFSDMQPVNFTPQIINASNMGSCCLCEKNTTEIKCLDYVNSAYCTNIGGSFNTTSCLDRISSGDCFAEGACCVNGKCINSSLDKCIQFKGSFFPGEVCAGRQNQSSHFTCPNTCPVPVPGTGRCCYRGFCFDLKESECSSIPDATFTANATCTSVDHDTNCCIGLLGACCTKIDDNYECTQKTANQCSNQNGIFHGIASKCEEIQCCGTNFIQDYFNDDTGCKITTVEPCLPIGSKVGGGYLVGVIGMPSPCSPYSDPLGAYGQPLMCRVLPRGEVNGTNGYLWNWKNCGGIRNSALGASGAFASDVNIEYFVRTKSSSGIDLSYTNNALNKCLLKYGTPYIQQTLTDITTLQGINTTVKWNDMVQYVNSPEYNAANGRFSYPIGPDGDLNYIIAEKHSDSSPLYKYLASQVYGSNSVHMLWALIVAPEDAYEGNNLSWGMEEGRARIGSFNDEPITTFAVDGLLSTRMFDSSSKNNPRLWFRGEGNQDLKAYDRFCFYNGFNIAKRSNWRFSVVESAIETNIQLFSEKYADLWENNNPQNSCTRQVSLLNETQYKGYNDWYIPSIVELNYINNNIVELNSQILVNGDTPLQSGSNIEYWSSTSVCYLKNWSSGDHLDFKKYELEELATELNKNETFNFKKNMFSGLNDKTAYELSLNVCAGENMITQKFAGSNTPSSNDGLMQSRSRRNGAAKFRPVRRIPIILGCVDQNIESILNDAYFSNCPSCPGECSQ